MDSWTYIGDKSSLELQFPALHNALTTTWKRISKSNTYPMSKKHKIPLVLLQYRKVELFLSELARGTDVSVCWHKNS